MSSPPPPYPQGHGQNYGQNHGQFHGQQPWAPYPGAAGPPPPPPRKTGLVWAVVGVVLVLVAAAVTFFLVRDDNVNGGGGGGGGGGGDAGQAECDGEYCVGEYPYVNACTAFDPSSAAARVGAVGSEGLRVQEVYADPLPTVEGDVRPAWTYGVSARCHVSPVDIERAAFRSVTLDLKQTAAEADAPTVAGRPLPGADGAVVEDSEGVAEVHWRHRNVTARLEVVWTNRKPAIPDAKIAEVVTAVTAAIENPTSEPRDLGELSSGGKRVVNDACVVFTGEDFQKATRYAVNPANVTRVYNATPGGFAETSCRRFTAVANSGFPAADGATYLEGSMAPMLRVVAHRDAAAAKAAHDEQRERLVQAVAVPGIGDGAVFGIRDGSAFTLRFTSGFHQVSLDCGLSNGNSHWTPDDMRARLEPLAKAIADRMR